MVPTWGKSIQTFGIDHRVDRQQGEICGLDKNICKISGFLLNKTLLQFSQNVITLNWSCRESTLHNPRAPQWHFLPNPYNIFEDQHTRRYKIFVQSSLQSYFVVKFNIKTVAEIRPSPGKLAISFHEIKEFILITNIPLL